MTPSSNIILIGMPGSGKSTVGRLLAKTLSRPFLDTDVLIETSRNRPLQDLVDSLGLDAFRALEEETILSLAVSSHVIATGGSVVYSAPAMAHLESVGVLVYLSLPFDVIRTRVRNLDSRGLVRLPGESLLDLYNSRCPLYARYADFTIDCSALSHHNTVSAILAALKL